MPQQMASPVTIIYFQNGSIELHYQILLVKKSPSGRVILEPSFSKNKTILAVLRGEVDVMNKFGDRMLDFY